MLYDYEEKPLEQAIESATKFVDPKKGIITEFYANARFNDEPKLYSYTTKYRSEDKKDDTYNGGCSLNEDKAKMKALGEALERYCVSVNPKFIRASYKSLKSALDPLKVASVSEKHKEAHPRFRVDHSTKFNWVLGRDLHTNKPAYVPAQLVYVPYHYFKNEAVIRLPITTGAAGGSSLAGAVYRGILEIIEREAFMITYLNKLPRKEIDLTTVKDKDIQDIVKAYERYDLEIHAYDCSTDLGFNAVMGMSIDYTGMGPAHSIGMKASLSPKEAILGALEEAQHTRPWMRQLGMDEKNAKKINRKGCNLNEIKDRGMYWYKKDMNKHLDFLLKNKRKTAFNNLENYAGRTLKENLTNAISAIPFDSYYVDVTVPAVKRAGYRAVKVVIPELQPLYLNENHPYWGGERLYSVPKTLGYTKQNTTEKQLHKIPHPFL